PDVPEPDGAICGDVGNPGPFIPQVIIDAVEYFDFGEWPDTADGQGASLERSNPYELASDASSWTANLTGSATPGAPNSTQPTRGQQSCMNALAKDMSKVASDAGKEIGGCVKDHARGKLGMLSFAECLVADRRGKVAKAEMRTQRDFDKRCTGNDSSGIPSRPFFGVTDAVTVNLAAKTQAIDGLLDLVGADPGTALVTEVTDRAASRCQRAIIGTAKKCADTAVKVFNKCEKLGLKNGSVQDGSGIGACIGSDPRGKIAKVCDPASGKVAKDIVRKCVNKGVSLAPAFPGCAAETSTDLAACVNSSARCRTCRGISTGTAAIISCDLFDDGVDNDSCP
ncbi:MAG: hypothetical protein ACE5D3_04160, partial [Candidatus Binatia bacterium]